MNRNPSQLGAHPLPGEMPMKVTEYEPYPVPPRITLKEKVTQQYNQINMLEKALREIETLMFGDVKGDRCANNAEQVYNGIESVIIENGETLERCLKLAYSITERI